MSLGDKDKGGVPTGLCIVGGKTVGQQSENLTWNQMHDVYHGGGLRTYTSDTVVNGWRIRNTADGFQPRDGENWTLVNNYYEYIRDDCVENDDRLGGAIYDSLFDGCYTGLSEQDAGSTAGETLILDGVLMRLQPMPGPYNTNDPTILVTGRSSRSSPMVAGTSRSSATQCSPPRSSETTTRWTGRPVRR